MIKVLKYMAITAAAMAVIEAHALDTPSDYKLFNMAIAKTVIDNPECFSTTSTLMANMTTELRAVTAILGDTQVLGAPNLTGLDTEINQARELSALVGTNDILTSRCAFLLGQAYGGMTGYFFFHE